MHREQKFLSRSWNAYLSLIEESPRLAGGITWRWRAFDGSLNAGDAGCTENPAQKLFRLPGKPACYCARALERTKTTPGDSRSFRHGEMNVRIQLPAQPVDATHSLNRSAGVWKSSVFRGRSLSSRATLLSWAWEYDDKLVP
jgi:hypothetical protein